MLAIRIESTLPPSVLQWRLHARSPSGELWVAEHEDYDKAACILAEMVGFKLKQR
ncbi:hypothetical protein PHYC_03267 [Phycisphaerales bacterium]|nr:hypothetical protein PHYC_03267 [Phycisphaerales bacterium]